MTKLVESNVAQHGECHEEDEGSIEQDESGLSNVCIIEKDKTSSQYAGRERVAGFPHDPVDGRDGQRAHCSGHCAVRDIWHLVGNVGVANVFKEKVSIIAYEPASKGEKELAKGRMDVEEVGSLEVV